MKKRTRGFALLVCLLLCLSLAACEENPIDSTKASSAAGAVDVRTLQTGNWTSVNPDKLIGCPITYAVGEGGYYYFDNSLLHFLDTSNGISVTLCSKAGCLHENASGADIWDCEAYLGYDNIFYYDNGYIYYDKSDHGQHLYRRKADGSGEEKVTTLWQAYAGNEYAVTLNDYIVTDGILYYTVVLNTATQDAAGGLVLEDAYSAILRLDLANGKEEELLKTSDAGITLVTAKKDALVYLTQDLLSMDGLEGSEKIQAYFNSAVSLQLWTKEAGCSKALLNKPYREFPRVEDFNTGEVLVSNVDTGLYYTYNLVTGECRETPQPVGTVLNENYRILINGAVYDVQAGRELPNAFSDVETRFYGKTDKGFIMVRIYYESDEADEDGGRIVKEQIYSYVTFDSLSDGLQVHDAKDFLAKK